MLADATQGDHVGSSRALTGPVLVIPLAVIVAVVIWRGRADKRSWWAIVLRIALAAWATTLVSLALFPLPLPPYEAIPEAFGDYRGWPYPWVSPVPFETIASSLGKGWEWPAARYLAGNLAAFVPLGILAPMISGRWRSWTTILMLAGAVSLSVEITQLVLSLGMGFPWRVADVDDLVLNVAGTLFGYGLWSLGRFAVTRTRLSVWASHET